MLNSPHVENTPHRAQMTKVKPTDPAPDTTFLGEVKIPGPGNGLFFQLSLFKVHKKQKINFAYRLVD